METKKSKEASQTVADSVNANEAGASRRELLVQGSKIAAGLGVAALLGDVGAFPIQSYGMGRSTMSLLDSLITARTALLVIDMQRDFLLPRVTRRKQGWTSHLWPQPSTQSESCSLWREKPAC